MKLFNKFTKLFTALKAKYTILHTKIRLYIESNLYFKRSAEFYQKHHETINDIFTLIIYGTFWYTVRKLAKKSQGKLSYYISKISKFIIFVLDIYFGDMYRVYMLKITESETAYRIYAMREALMKVIDAEWPKGLKKSRLQRRDELINLIVGLVRLPILFIHPPFIKLTARILLYLLKLIYRFVVYIYTFIRKISISDILRYKKECTAVYRAIYSVILQIYGEYCEKVNKLQNKLLKTYLKINSTLNSRCANIQLQIQNIKNIKWRKKARIHFNVELESIIMMLLKAFDVLSFFFFKLIRSLTRIPIHWICKMLENMEKRARKRLNRLVNLREELTYRPLSLARKLYNSCTNIIARMLVVFLVVFTIFIIGSIIIILLI